MKVPLCVCLLLTVTRAADEFGRDTFTKNNPLSLKEGRAFFSDIGEVFDLYSADKEIRNLLVPPSDYLSNFNYTSPDPKKHPIVFFNLYKNGRNDGVYMLKEQKAKKIRDGTDVTADYPTGTLANYANGLVYISAEDGIYTYNPKDDVTEKFGTITDNFRAIDKLWNKDELYALADDNKIYKITSQGTVKTKVDGIEYAKDFVVDLLGAIYFLGENSKPQVLYQGSTSPVKINGLQFDTSKAFLGRPLWDPYSVTYTSHLVPLIVDGVSFLLLEAGVLATPCKSVVPGLTAYSTEYSWVQFYGAKGQIYIHTPLANFTREGSLKYLRVFGGVTGNHKNNQTRVRDDNRR